MSRPTISCANGHPHGLSFAASFTLCMPLCCLRHGRHTLNYITSSMSIQTASIETAMSRLSSVRTLAGYFAPANRPHHALLTLPPIKQPRSADSRNDIQSGATVQSTATDLEFVKNHLSRTPATTRFTFSSLPEAIQNDLLDVINSREPEKIIYKPFSDFLTYLSGQIYGECHLY